MIEMSIVEFTQLLRKYPSRTPDVDIELHYVMTSVPDNTYSTLHFQISYLKTKLITATWNYTVSFEFHSKLHLQIQAVMWKYSVFERYSNRCIKLDILALVDQYLFQYVQLPHEHSKKAF